MGQEGAFAIYQTATGFTAVTNPVQRQILEALEDEDRQLPDLVVITGRAKPTLSGIHMKELLNRELVEELPHPSDSRRKIFHLTAKRIGASDVPVDQLRSAVQRYAGVTSRGWPLAQVFRVLAAAPAKGADGVLAAQAQELGRQCAGRLASTDAREFALALSKFVEEEGLARHLQIDFEHLEFRCAPGSGVEQVPAQRMGLLLAAFAEGAAEAGGLEGVAFTTSADGDAFRLTPR